MTKWIHIYQEERFNYTILWCHILTPYINKSFFAISKFKQSIRTVQHDLHIKNVLRDKIYIIWKITIFLAFLKNSYFSMVQNCLKTSTLYKS